jgi:hypothetical protein
MAPPDPDDDESSGDEALALGDEEDSLGQLPGLLGVTPLQLPHGATVAALAPALGPGVGLMQRVQLVYQAVELGKALMRLSSPHLTEQAEKVAQRCAKRELRMAHERHAGPPFCASLPWQSQHEQLG